MPAPINDLAVDLLRRYTNTLGRLSDPMSPICR